MSRYIDSLRPGPKPSPQESLTSLVVRHVGVRAGLPSLSDPVQHQALLKAMEQALTIVPADELRHLLQWVFERNDDFWRDRLREARRVDRFFIKSLPTMLRHYREDRSAPHYKPKRQPQTRFMASLKSITPKVRM